MLALGMKRWWRSRHLIAICYFKVLKACYDRLAHRHDLMVATIHALVALGGSGSIEEIRERVIELLAVPDEVANLSGTDGIFGKFVARSLELDSECSRSKCDYGPALQERT